MAHTETKRSDQPVEGGIPEPADDSRTVPSGGVSSSGSPCKGRWGTGVRETQPIAYQANQVARPNGEDKGPRRFVAIAAGAVCAFALSWFFPVPLVPVLVGIAIAARFGRSETWRTGLLYGL